MVRGSSSRSGPAPDPNALRRDRDGKDWVHLPAEGRQGEPPDWPLSDPTLRELALWAIEWKRPQAVMWETNGQQNEVALYVRSLKDAEKSDATTAARQLVKQQMEALGLSIPGLRGNRWVIDVQPEQPQVTRADDSSDRRSARKRLTALTGGAA